MKEINNPTPEQIREIAAEMLHIDGSNMVDTVKTIRAMFFDQSNKLKVVADNLRVVLRGKRVSHLVDFIKKNGNDVKELRNEAECTFACNGSRRDLAYVAPYIKMAWLQLEIDRLEFAKSIHGDNWSETDRGNFTESFFAIRAKMDEVVAQGLPL